MFPTSRLSTTSPSRRSTPKPRAGARQRRYHAGPVKTLLVLDAPVPSVVSPSTWLPSDMSTRLCGSSALELTRPHSVTSRRSLSAWPTS
ncbi:hypothetical protein PRIPAC_75502 [Pristionchus pacificus]|uniref:Uncharacterized protein n=1 Tax=Pristionchus pacificus TaxID=54126 RepID=A0A2A6C691_PRIPA|nr:hypothetical protein PRIPAC_75502 [Pristionchus pacificus]|eukprot:PDM73627.1 hypothetical protein PRIPAC_40983 [Pristionchus pacificus]